MKKFLGSLAILMACAALHSAAPAAPAVNDWSRDEFQFTFGFDNPLTKGDRKSSPHSTVYLYIPAAAKKVRAVLLLQQNVIEQKISVHPAIRQVCDANDIAIAWCTPGFDLIFKDNPGQLLDLVQERFRQFGRSIGYPELGDAPLIGFGHSNTTAYAQNAAEARPERMLAVLVTHGWNGVDSLNRYRGPILVFIGSYWEQKQQTLRNGASKGVASIAKVEERLKRSWLPITVVEECGSGHFDYSEPVMKVFAMFIDKAVKARLNPDGSLRDIDPKAGWIAMVPEFPDAPIPIKPYAEGTPEEKAMSVWFFDREMAEAVVKVINGNGPWHRGSQLIGYNRADGTPAPFGKSGLVDPVPYRLAPGTDEIQIFPALLPAFPAGFVEAGQRNGQPANPEITLEYDCGPYLYRDQEGKYRVKLNRGGFSGYIVARNLGDSLLRPAVQATRLMLVARDRTGNASAIVPAPQEDGAAFWSPVGPAPIANPGPQKCGARIALPPGRSPLEYLGYYVDHGPARVVGGELEILPLPANTRGPLEVQLTAYRLGQTVMGLSSVTFPVAR